MGTTGRPRSGIPLAMRRDELIGPIVTTLSRRLKRTLQDSQNELLDSLRSNGSRWSDRPAARRDRAPRQRLHRRRSRPGAGGRGRGVLRRLQGASGPKTDVLLSIAHELAEAVVGPLRRRLADG